MDEHIGQVFGYYRLLRLLARGGYSTIYLGEHIYLQRRVAIKMPVSNRLTQNDVEDFLTEARILASLDHPHIVQMLDFGVHDNIPYLVLEYLPYGSLADRYHRERKLPIATIVSYINQVASALQEMHDHHLIHRNVKLSNILLRSFSEVLLSGFGLAGVQNQSKPLQILGTHASLAPEQWNEEFLPATDQYALAFVAYELLTGHLPFRGGLPQLLQEQLQGPPPSSSFDPSIPSTIDPVLLRALTREPEHRFSSVSAFARALRFALQNAPSSLPQDLSTLSLITNALEVGSRAVNDEGMYQNLRSLIQHKCTSSTIALFVLAKYGEKPEIWKEPLKDELAQIGADQDREIISAAQKILSTAPPSNPM